MPGNSGLRLPVPGVKMLFVTKAARELLESALQLTPDERVRLAHDLLCSVDNEDVGELSGEWLEEIQLRVDRAISGAAEPDEDWRIVLDRIRRRQTERSA